MLKAPLKVLSIKCPSVVYVNSPSHSLNIRHPPVVYYTNYWWIPYA
jgi:hypothetical protein